MALLVAHQAPFFDPHLIADTHIRLDVVTHRAKSIVFHAHSNIVATGRPVIFFHLIAQHRAANRARDGGDIAPASAAHLMA